MPDDLPATVTGPSGVPEFYVVAGDSAWFLVEDVVWFAMLDRASGGPLAPDWTTVGIVDPHDDTYIQLLDSSMSHVLPTVRDAHQAYLAGARAQAPQYEHAPRTDPGQPLPPRDA